MLDCWLPLEYDRTHKRPNCNDNDPHSRVACSYIEDCNMVTAWTPLLYRTVKCYHTNTVNALFRSTIGDMDVYVLDRSSGEVAVSTNCSLICLCVGLGDPETSPPTNTTLNGGT